MHSMNICCRFKGQFSSTPCSCHLSLLLSEEFFQCSAPIEIRCNRYLVGQHVYFYLWTLQWSNTILFVLLLFLKQHIIGLRSGGLFPDYKPCLITRNGCGNKGGKTPSCGGTVIRPHCLCDCTPLMPLLRVMTLHVKYAIVSFSLYLHNLKVQTFPFLVVWVFSQCHNAITFTRCEVKCLSKLWQITMQSLQIWGFLWNNGLKDRSR